MEKRRILIVEDSKPNLRILSDALRGEYNVLVATTGEKALESVKTLLPDLILLDIMLPGIDGFAVCEQLKENPATRNIPVVFLSGAHDAKNRARGEALGAVAFIAKPFIIDDVLRQVGTALVMGGI